MNSPDRPRPLQITIKSDLICYTPGCVRSKPFTESSAHTLREPGDDPAAKIVERHAHEERDADVVLRGERLLQDDVAFPWAHCPPSEEPGTATKARAR